MRNDQHRWLWTLSWSSADLELKAEVLVARRGREAVSEQQDGARALGMSAYEVALAQSAALHEGQALVIQLLWTTEQDDQKLRMKCLSDPSSNEWQKDRPKCGEVCQLMTARRQ